MSDPVKNAEIEDVLTSIRKLVADEARPVPPARKPDRAQRPERLVLTPEQRVKDGWAARFRRDRQSNGKD